MPDRPTATTRRTAIAGALGGLALIAGCDLDDLDPTADPTPSDGQPDDFEPAQDADATLVDEVLNELQGLIELLSVEGSKHPRLAEPLTTLVDLHLAHREALGGDPIAAGIVAEPTPRPAEALLLIRTRELSAQRRLTDWCVRANSGALARLLASMSAAVAQHVTALPSSLGSAR